MQVDPIEKASMCGTFEGPLTDSNVDLLLTIDVVHRLHHALDFRALPDGYRVELIERG
jgi:hypothetical protein